jgi:hypothetical protein
MVAQWLLPSALRMRRLNVLIGFAWLLAVSAGMSFIWHEQSGAGGAGLTPRQWPSDTGLAPDTNRDTLIMFVHPRCPCTRASIEELNRLLARYHRSVTTHIFVFKPANASNVRTQTDLQNSIAAIPGLLVQDDPGNFLAEKFGAKTSGYIVLYDSQGQLLFSGGITDGRGHIGDNAGESAVEALLSGQPAQLRQTPVYGCSLNSWSTTTNQ